jgi:post-segregation antitoxin (ccd killing protein)
MTNLDLSHHDATQEGERMANHEPGSAEDTASGHVSVELPATLVTKARAAGVDVEAVCRAAISTALALRSNWTAMRRASRSAMDEIVGRFKR